MNWFTTLLPIATLLVGALLTFFAESIRHRRLRQESLEDGLRSKRAETYIDFLSAAHSAAHLLGRMAPGCPHPIEPDTDTYWFLDSDVSRKLRSLQLVGTEPVVRAALSLELALREFRRVIDRGDRYGTPEYWDAYGPVSVSRDGLIRTARSEIVSSK